MFITKKHISRRAVLRGAGVALVARVRLKLTRLAFVPRLAFLLLVLAQRGVDPAGRAHDRVTSFTRWRLRRPKL